MKKQPPLPKKLAIQKSIYPLDYNKNNPMSGYNEWCQYIAMQNASEPMERLMDQANEILATNAKRPR